MNNSPNTIGELVDLVHQRYHSLINQNKDKAKGFKKRLFNRAIAEMQGLYGEKLEVRSVGQMLNWYNYFRSKNKIIESKKDQSKLKQNIGIQIPLFA
jgi:hypothetical protein